MNKNSLLIDTCVLSYIFSPKNPKIIKKSKKYWEIVKDTIGFVSIISVGELYAWIVKENWPDEDKKKLQKFLDKAYLINLCDNIAKLYGDIRIKDKLLYNDAWIAACAKHKGILVLTDNRRDFKHYCYRPKERWTQSLS